MQIHLIPQCELTLCPDNESRSGRKKKLTEAQTSWDISTSSTGFGRLIFLRCKRPRKAENDDENGVESQTSITFIPRISWLRQMINVRGHTPFWNDTESLPPIFSINNVLEAGSEVFHVVFNGDVEELKRMFEEGEASIRDHDEHGASLLHVCRKSNLCKEFETWLLTAVTLYSTATGSRKCVDICSISMFWTSMRLPMTLEFLSSTLTSTLASTLTSFVQPTCKSTRHSSIS